MHLQEGFALGFRGRVATVALKFWHRHAETLRELTHGVLETDFLPEFQELEHIAADTAAKAVKEASITIHVKRRGFF